MPFINPITVGAAARVGGALGGLIGGKRNKSSCRIVATEDLDGFRAGSVAPWVLDDRVQDIYQALGKYPVSNFGTGAYGNPNAPTLGLTVADVADLHVSQFVPLCQQIEGGESGFTTDPMSGEGLAVYNAAREEFRNRLRSGRILFGKLPRGGNGGDAIYGPGVGLTPGALEATRAASAPRLLAGGGLVWAALAAVALFTLRK